MPALFLIVFVDLVGFGIIIPLLPFYGEHFDASPDQVGLLMATYSFAQFLSAPAWGRLSDRVGRRPVLVVTLVGSTVAYVGLAFADSLVMLFAARAFGGAMAGNISTAFAYVADVTSPAQRARGMGLIGAAFGLGFSFGPAIGGILAGDDPVTADYRTPALVAAAFSLVALGLTVAMLKESLSAEVRARQASIPRHTRAQQFRDALTRPGVGLLVLTSFMAILVFAGLESTFAMWARRSMGWGPQQTGILLAFVGLFTAAIQGGLVGRLAKMWGERNLVIQGAVALAIGMVLIPLAPSLPVLILAMAIVGYGFGVISPSLNSLISLQVPAEHQGGMMGVSRSAATLGRVVGPALAGVVFAHFGKDWPFFAGAVVMMGVLGLAIAASRQISHDGKLAER